MIWIVLIATFALGLFASSRVKSAYNKWVKVPARSGWTGAQVAQRILQMSGIHDVEVVAVPGQLSDHYDPTNRRLALSEENYYGTSVAALGVSAHECGHALQHAKNYGPLHLRMASVGITQFASSWMLFVPLILGLIGLIPFSAAIYVVIIGLGIIMFFNLVTLPVEFDATARAKKILWSQGFVTPDEAKGVDKVLNAAAWTYVAAFISSLAHLLMYLLPLLGNSDE